LTVRDAVRDCLRSQMDGSTEEHVSSKRGNNSIWLTTVLLPLWSGQCPRQPARLRRRPRFAVAAFAGNYNDETKRATKATIFRERTIHHKQPVESVGTPKEALLVTLERARLR
jgi:hypothetical protein